MESGKGLPFDYSKLGTVGSAEERAEGLERMRESLSAYAAEREAERERSRIAAAEYEERWKVKWAATGMDDSFKVPGTIRHKDGTGEKVDLTFESDGHGGYKIKEHKGPAGRRSSVNRGDKCPPSGGGLN